MRRTIEERGLVDRGMRVLAACSGGPDSGAMLFALARLAPELGIALEAASVDHGLRPTSAADVDVARQQAAAAGVPFHALAVQVPVGGSLQAQARLARYEALRACAHRIGAARIAVAHTRDDQAETVVLRLLRGAGIAGLAGVTPRREDGVVRPLIDCARADVLAYAERHCPAIAVDASNRDPSFERVRVRERVLPVLLAEDRAVITHLADVADDARELWEALVPAAQALLVRATEDAVTLRVSALAAAPSAVRRVALRHWVLRETGAPLGRAALDQLDHALGRSADVWLPAPWRVVVDAERLRLERRPATAP